MKKTISLTEFAQNEWREYSLYTIEERAIPSMIDGLKPVQRFIMHSAMKSASKDMKKVTAIAGPVAEYGYHHGEQNAQGAAQLMAAGWCNNQPLLLGDGNFGGRLVNEGAAARYVFAKVHPEFFNLYQDFDLCPEHIEEEHIPPRYYLPVIPMVLVNGIKGVATGYATEILPYSVKDIRNACAKYIKTGDITGLELTPTFYGFKGVVRKTDVSSFETVGLFERQGKTSILITEVPIGYDREAYVNVLNTLRDSGDIIRYKDQCDKSGFRFKVDMKRGTDTMSDEALLKMFKLVKSITQNLTVLDQDRKLRKYESPNELIKDFCDFRIPIYSERIQNRLTEARQKYKIAVAKCRFINMVLNQQIDFKGKSKKDLTDLLTQTFDVSIVPNLLGMEFYSLTQEEIRRQMAIAKELDAERQKWESATPTDQFLIDLKQI